MRRCSHSAQDSGSADAGDRLHERGGAQRDALALGEVVHLAKGLDELVLFLALNLFERPAEVLEVLDPLEVADDDAAGIGEHVGDDRDAAGVEDLVGLGPGRRVGGLDDRSWPATALASSRSNTPPSAAGIRTSTGMVRSCSLVVGVASLEADDLVRDARRACRARRCRAPRG